MSESRQTETTAIAVAGRPAHALMRPVASSADLVALHQETTAILTKALTKGVDYGAIPGTDKDKPVLLKPGAERIVAAFGCYPRYLIHEKEIDHDREVAWCKRKKKWDRGKYAGEEEQRGISLGLYRYVVICEIVNRATDKVVGQGLGSCSTMESKYVDRPRDCENVVLKMAEKRALVGATLNTFELSGRFDQDLEDREDRKEQRPSTERHALASQIDLDLLRRLACHQDFPKKQRDWLVERLAKASANGGLTADSAATIIKGLKPEWLALVPRIDPDALPDWGDQPEPPREREPGEEVE